MEFIFGIHRDALFTFLFREKGESPYENTHYRSGNNGGIPNSDDCQGACGQLHIG
jgi:hypothetical protein